MITGPREASGCPHLALAAGTLALSLGSRIDSLLQPCTLGEPGGEGGVGSSEGPGGRVRWWRSRWAHHVSGD